MLQNAACTYIVRGMHYSCLENKNERAKHINKYIPICKEFMIMPSW